MQRRLFWNTTYVLGFALAFCGTQILAAEARSAANSEGLTLVVMDPLALPLSCPCVKGYAQRDYDQLGKYLAQQLKTPVTVVFSDSLPAALANKTQGKADVVIGKDSVVRRQAKKAGLGMVHLAALTGLDGKTTENGLFVVPTNDPALSVTDLKGYRIILGPEDCDEKHLAAQNVFVQSGMPKLHKPETCSACSDGATKILDLYKQGTKSATIISSYAKPLLEGCGTIKKGDLRIIGETEAVPFIGAFANAKLSPARREALATALVDVGRHPELCKALETKAGFVPATDLAGKVTAKKIDRAGRLARMAGTGPRRNGGLAS